MNANFIIAAFMITDQIFFKVKVKFPNGVEKDVNLLAIFRHDELWSLDIALNELENQEENNWVQSKIESGAFDQLAKEAYSL
jgi:predicted CoA-binding protein